MRDGSGSTLSMRVNIQNQHDDNDWFRADETVIYHWDRIFAALGIVLLIVLATAWGLWHLLQPSDKMIAEDTPPEPIFQNVEPISAAPSVESPTAETRVVDVVETPDVLESLSPPAAEDPKPLSEEPVKPGPAPAIVGQTFAQVEIQSEHLTRAQLTPDLDAEREPVGYAPEIIPMNSDGLIRVYFFTEMDGLKGATVHHDWYLEDERSARVTVHPHLDTMKASSSKFIDRHMRGKWRVEVHTDAGESLALSEFEVR